MGPAQLLMFLLDLAAEYARRQQDPSYAFAAQAFQTAKQLYEDTKIALLQTSELSEADAAQMDAKAEAIFSSASADPNQNA